MNCDEYNLSLYIDHMLNAEETRAVAAHLRECEECRRTYNELEEMRTSLRAFGELALPTGFHQEAMAMIREVPDTRIDFVTLRKRLKPAGGAFDFGRLGTVAAGLLITVMLFGGLGSLFLGGSSGAVANDGMKQASAEATRGMAAAEAPVRVNGDALPAAEQPELMVMAAAELAAAAAAGEIVAAAPAATAMPETARMDAQAFAVAEDSILDSSEIAAKTAAETEAVMNSAADRGAGEPLLFAGAVEEPQSGEQTVKYYNIALTVEDIDAAMAVVDSLPGRNTNSNIVNGGSYIEAGMVRSVAAADYEQVKTTLRGLGTITNESESAQRVFLNVADTQARAQAKEVEIERLYELLRRSESVNAMVAIERRLEATSGELDRLRSQKAQFSRELSSPTFNISLSYRDTTPEYKTVESFGERLSASFIRSLNYTFLFIEGVAVLISSVGFQLLILCVLIYAVYLVRSALRRRRHGNE